MRFAGRLRRPVDFRFLFGRLLRVPFAFRAADHVVGFEQGGHVQPLTKRQREILDYLNDFILQHGYAPSLEEIGKRFSLSSLATVHKHLTNLQQKGFIKRAWNRSRSVELLPTRTTARAVELPLLGVVAAGAPIEAIVGNETIEVPESLVGKRDTYVLRVRGDSMIDEQIRDGDLVIVEDRRTADNGETVVALLSRHRGHAEEALSRARARAAAAGQPDHQADHRAARTGPGAGRGHRRDAALLACQTAEGRTTHEQRTQAHQLHDRAGRNRGS